MMLEKIIIISLIITAIHVVMLPGMLLSCVREFIYHVTAYCHTEVLRMPLCDCVICMGGIYTLAIYPVLFSIDWQIIPVMLGVIGLNVVMSALLKYLYNEEND